MAMHEPNVEHESEPTEAMDVPEGRLTEAVDKFVPLSSTRFAKPSTVK